MVEIIIEWQRQMREEMDRLKAEGHATSDLDAKVEIFSRVIGMANSYNMLNKIIEKYK